MTSGIIDIKKQSNCKVHSKRRNVVMDEYTTWFNTEEILKKSKSPLFCDIFCELCIKTLNLGESSSRYIHDGLNSLHWEHHTHNLTCITNKFNNIKSDYNMWCSYPIDHTSDQFQFTIISVIEFLIEEKSNIIKILDFTIIHNLLRKYEDFVKSVSPNLFKTPSKRTQ